MTSELSPKERLAQRFYLQSAARHLLPESRLKICWRYRLPGKEHVEIVHNVTARRGHVRGLMRCALAWSCPVCAARISEERRKDLSDAISRRRETLFPVMVTYTMSHNQGERLDVTLKAVIDAYRRTRSGRAWQYIKDEYFIMGGVRATEITYGAGGWHPHIHEILFVDVKYLEHWRDGDGVNLYGAGNAIKKQLFPLWSSALKKGSRYCDEQHGVNVTIGGDDVGEYVTKFGHLPNEIKGWGSAEEVTKQVTKTASRGGMTPFEILSEYAGGNKRAGALFVEYHNATAGRSMLQWARGTRDLLGLNDEQEDSEVIEGDDTERAILMARISFEHWREVIKAGRVADVVNCAANLDHDGLHSALDALKPASGADKVICLPCMMEKALVGHSVGGGRVFVCPNCGDETELT